MGVHTPVATPQAHLTSRVDLKPPGAAAGHVDGAWWPYTRNLTAELPALLTTVAGRSGYAERVTYNLTVWRVDADHLTVDGRVVRLEGFRSHNADTVTVTGDERRLTILAVPPATEPATAWHTMTVAAEPGNIDSPETLLSAEPTSHTALAAALKFAQRRWDADVGQLGPTV